MASKLTQALEKGGVFTVQKSSKKKSSNMPEAKAPSTVKAAVDQFLKAQIAFNDAKAQIETATGAIRSYALDHAFDQKTLDNFQIVADEGAVNVIIKEQYSALTDVENSEGVNPKEELVKFLKSKKVKPEDVIEEESTVAFNFDALTKEEQKKLLNFITKELGAERASEVVSDQTTYKISGLKDQMLKICKTREEFDKLRELSGHFAPTIAVRK
jgi:hypothetical protein